MMKLIKIALILMMVKTMLLKWTKIMMSFKNHFKLIHQLIFHILKIMQKKNIIIKIKTKTKNMSNNNKI